MNVRGRGTLTVKDARQRRRSGKATAAAVTRLARSTRRVTKAGTVRVVLKVSKAKRAGSTRTLSGKRKSVKATIRTAYKPTGRRDRPTRRTLMIRG